MLLLLAGASSTTPCSVVADLRQTPGNIACNSTLAGPGAVPCANVTMELLVPVAQHQWTTTKSRDLQMGLSSVLSVDPQSLGAVTVDSLSERLLNVRLVWVPEAQSPSEAVPVVCNASLALWQTLLAPGVFVHAAQ